MILEQIGIEYEDRSIESYLEPMLIEFHGRFPTTREFSAYARNTITDADPVENPDDTLLKWVNREEALFKLLEQYLIKERIQQGFKTGEDVDVDAFIQFSLSVQNRRKSRAGLSLENHIEALLKGTEKSYIHIHQLLKINQSRAFYFSQYRSIQRYDISKNETDNAWEQKVHVKSDGGKYLLRQRKTELKLC